MTLSKEEQEPENTVDTPSPIPVAPPPQPVEPLETDQVAVPVDANPRSSSSASKTSNIPSTCTVIAPATLDVGYSFTANVDDIDFVVTVPEGGVTEGQAFRVPYPTTTTTTSTSNGASNNSNITNGRMNTADWQDVPTGRWRVEMFDCFEVFFTGIFWQGLCCTPILMAQVMQRSKLNACGMPSASYQKTFWIVFGIWLFFIIMFIIFRSYVFSLWLLFVTIIIMNTRYHIRKKYNIPVTNTKGCDGKLDDCCCGFWCSCCVTIQMARHTHDHSKYPYQCCSQTGLDPNVAEVA